VASDGGNFLFSASGLCKTAGRRLAQTVQHASVGETCGGNRIGHHVPIASVAKRFVERGRQNDHVLAWPCTKRSRQVRVERNVEPGAGLSLNDVDGVSRQVRPRHVRNVGAALTRVKV